MDVGAVKAIFSHFHIYFVHRQNPSEENFQVTLCLKHCTLYSYVLAEGLLSRKQLWTSLSPVRASLIVLSLMPGSGVLLASAD